MKFYISNRKFIDIFRICFFSKIRVQTPKETAASAFSRKLENQIFLGFAAETGSDNEIKEKGEKKRISKGCDLLMANPIDRDGQGFAKNFNSGFLLGPQKMIKKLSFSTKLSISHQLLNEIRNLKSKIY